jgi:hypothetical protein
MACSLAQSLPHRVTKPWLPMEKPRMYPGGIEETAWGSSAASGQAVQTYCTRPLGTLRYGDRNALHSQLNREGHLSSFVSLPAAPVVVMVTRSPIPMAPVSMPPLSLSPVPMRRAIVSPHHERRSHHNHRR